MHPVFKRIDKFVNGKLCEFFYIDDKEVSSQVYYNLLENDFESNDHEQSDIKPTYEKSNNDIKNEKDFDIWIMNNVLFLKNVTNQEAFELLKYTYNYYYKYGYYLGQIAINQKYIEDMKVNESNAKVMLEELVTKQV